MLVELRQSKLLLFLKLITFSILEASHERNLSKKAHFPFPKILDVHYSFENIVQFNKTYFVL